MDRETRDYFESLFDSLKTEMAEGFAQTRAEAKAHNARLRRVMIHYGKATTDVLDQLAGENVAMRDAIEDLRRRVAALEQRQPPGAARLNTQAAPRRGPSQTSPENSPT